MVAIGRPLTILPDRPAERLPAHDGATGGTRSYDGAFLLAAIPAVLLHLLVITRGVSGPVADGAALTVAAAHDGMATAAADVAFGRQLAVALDLLEPVGGGLLQTARGVCLLAGLAAALLLWVVARRTLPGREAAAVAVVVAGSSPVALLLHAEVDAGALAAWWLVAAAAVAAAGSAAVDGGAVDGGGGGSRRWTGGFRVSPPAAAGAAVGVAAAVLTAPLAAAGVLALVAGLAVRDLPMPGGRGRVVVVIGAGVAAVGVAVLAVARTSPTTAADTVGSPLLVTTLVLGAGLVGAGFRRVPRLRPVAAAAAVWLGCALWPGTARLTALLLAVPLLALLAGGLIGAASTRRRLPVAAAVAVAVAFTAGVGTAVWPFGTQATADYAGVARWLSAELDPTTRLQAGALTRAELVAEGVPTDRFVDGPAPDTVRAVTIRSGCSSGEAVIATVPTPGGGVVLCLPAVPDAIPDIGPALAGNPALTLSAPARDALTRGLVDTRLAVVLAGATGSHRITIEDFPPTPGAPAVAPRRTAVLSAAPAVTGGPGLETYLAGQLPPYRPEVSRQPDGSLIVHFRIPSTPR